MTIPMKQERRNRDWTQQYVADQVGVTKSAINDMESGRRKPSYDVLVRLENLFGMSHRELFSDEKDKAGRSTRP